MNEWKRLVLQLERVSLHANITVLFWGQLILLSSLVLGHIWQMFFSFQICPSMFSVPCLERHVFGCSTQGREQCALGSEVAGLMRHGNEGWQQRGSHTRQQASRSLLTTPNSPLWLEKPLFPQRPLVFHHSAPVSSSAFPLPCHPSFLFCVMISGLGGLCPGSDHGSSCLKVCCEHLHS